MSKIAIIGSGISGLTTAYYLSRGHQVTLFESNEKPGGHTDTHEICVEGIRLRVDTGFIVFNDRTYPNFIRLLDQLGCESQSTEMSFSVQANGIEYNGHNLKTLFAQRSNLLSPRFLRMITDIFRFNRQAKDLTEIDQNMTLGKFLEENHYSDVFRKEYLYPMAAAIWSTGCDPVREFPVSALVKFFDHHGLLDLKNRPQWRVVTGGSDSYVKRMVEYLPEVRTGTPVKSIKRTPTEVIVQTTLCSEAFDQVVFATHSDQALKIIESPTPSETQILGAIRYTPNHVTLHTDQSLMPNRQPAWASWNYRLGESTSNQATVTYYMNRLQALPIDTPILVTLNDRHEIDESKIIKETTYQHPYFDHSAVVAQGRHREISGVNRTHYVGAYWGNGFHEDGVVSALRVNRAFGVNAC